MSYLQDLEEISRKNFIPVIKDEGRDFLIDFCKKNKPKKILEIGTAVGYSGCFILNNSDDNSILVTIEKNEQSYNKATQTFLNMGLNLRVTQLLGDAGEIIKQINEKFDMIFLDGPKGQYIKYLPYLLDLLQDNGTIVADNVLYRGLIRSNASVEHKHRTMITSLRKFLFEIENNKNLDTKVYDVGDGIATIKKKNN